MMIASILLILVASAGVMTSDLLIRARGLDGVNDIDASSYDFVFTVLLVLGTVGFVVGFLR